MFTGNYKTPSNNNFWAANIYTVWLSSYPGQMAWASYVDWVSDYLHVCTNQGNRLRLSMLASFPGSPTRGLKRKAGRGHTPSDGKLGRAVLQATKRWVGRTASNEKVGGAWERGYVCVPVDKISDSLKPIIQRRQTFIFHFMKIKHYWCCLANAPNTSPLRNIFGWALTLCTQLSFFCLP